MQEFRISQRVQEIILQFLFASIAFPCYEIIGFKTLKFLQASSYVLQVLCDKCKCKVLPEKTHIPFLTQSLCPFTSVTHYKEGKKHNFSTYQSKREGQKVFYIHGISTACHASYINPACCVETSIISTHSEFPPPFIDFGR